VFIEINFIFLCLLFFFFFFSSRRRHTRSDRDWSSDVCSSDLEPGHFIGKGYLKISFDRVILPYGDLPVPAKVIQAKGFKVDKKRSEEHTSELQSRSDLVCRLLLEKKKKKK